MSVGSNGIQYILLLGLGHHLPMKLCMFNFFISSLKLPCASSSKMDLVAKDFVIVKGVDIILSINGGFDQPPKGQLSLNFYRLCCHYQAQGLH